jgi:hypothetical protein
MFGRREGGRIADLRVIQHPFEFGGADTPVLDVRQFGDGFLAAVVVAPANVEEGW